MKKFISIMCILCLVMAAFTGCGSSAPASTPGGNTGGDKADDAPKYELRLSGQNAVDYFTIAATQRAIDKVYERSNGNISIKLYPSGVLGDYTLVFEEVMKGNIDMACLTIPSQFEPKLEISFMPYLVNSYADAKKLFKPGSFFYNTYTELHENLGLKLLGLVCEGSLGVGANKLNTANLADCTASKPNLMRVPPMDIFQLLAADMGFRTTSIPYADLYSALQTGVADGWFGGSPYVAYTNFRDVVNFWADYNYMFEVGGIIMNQKLFDSMPADYQKIIADAFLEESLKTFDEAEANNKESLELLRNAGVTIIEFTPEEIAGIAKHVQKNTWPKLEAKFGKDIIDGLLNDL